MPKNDTFLARHVAEIRLKNRLFSFIDFKGLLIDFLVKEADGNKIKVAEQRIDVANKDISKALFFSWENFGFQLEGNDSFDDFNAEIDKLIALIKKFQRYSVGPCARIGTKSTIFFHKKGLSMESIHQKFKDGMFKDYESLEQNISSKVIDVGYVFSDLDGDDHSTHLTIGPMTFKEVMTKEFGNSKRNIYQGFKENTAGLFLDIDVFQKKELDLHIDDLASQLKKNVAAIKKTMNGVLAYLFGENGK